MKRLLMGLALVGGGGWATAATAQTAYSGDRLIAAAEAQAKAASFPCETELNASGKAPACERYHSAVLKAMALQGRRTEWCQTQFSSEASNMRVPDSCLGKTSADMRVDSVEAVERKRSPATWRKFDQAMARLP